MVLCSGSEFVLGRFRCEPGASAWRQENRIGPHAVLAFPTIPVTIRHEDGPRRIADRTRVMLYNPGQVYQRGLVHPEGDRCVFIGLGEGLATQFAAELSRSATPDRFNRDHAHVPEQEWLTVRALAANAGAMDESAVEECVIELLAEISRANPVTPRETTRRASTLEAHRDLAEGARAELASSFTRTDSLSELARRLHTSPFHLARVFRAHTGRSIVGHRRTLRARAGLELLFDSNLPVAEIAHRVGYPGHAQFSAAFRQVFGRSPIAVRRLAPGRRARVS